MSYILECKDCSRTSVEIEENELPDEAIQIMFCPVCGTPLRTETDEGFTDV